jgi:hypothetical protein
MADFICPVCRAPRKMGASNHLAWTTHAQILIVTAAVSGGAYFFSGLEIALKSVLVYLPLWAACEFVHGVRVRESARCDTCGFDPILYRQDWKAARAQVEERLNKVLGETKAALLKRAENERARPRPGVVSQRAPATTAPTSNAPAPQTTTRVVKLGDRNV